MATDDGNGMAPKAAKFALSFLASMIVVSLYDRSEPAQWNLRGGSVFDDSNLPSSSLLSVPADDDDDDNGGRVLKEVVKTAPTFKSCSQFEAEDACSSHDSCRWCSNHLSNLVCVGSDTTMYKFAPCNNWICYTAKDPAKSNVEACERV